MAGSFLLTSDSTGASKNITSLLELATFTASAQQWVIPDVRLSALNGAAATITLTARHYASDGTTLIREQAYSFAKPRTTSTVAGDALPAVMLANGEKLTIAATSTNASDTSTAYTISWVNAGGSDLQYVFGTAQTTGDIIGSFPSGLSTLTIANNAVAANVTRWLGTAASTPTVAGVPNVNVKTWNDLTTISLPLVPTTAGRTLDIAATGEAGLDFDNIKDATGSHTLTNITVPVVTSVGTLTTYTGNTPQTGDAYLRIGAAGAGLTALGDTRIANLDAAISSRMATFTLPTGFTAATFPGGTIANTTNITAGTITTVTTVTNQLTAAQIATGVWQDATAGDFTTASSIGKCLYISNVAPGGSGGHLISGVNSGTLTLGALTVSGNTSFGGTLGISGVTTFGATVNMQGALQITNDFNVGGQFAMGGALSSGGADFGGVEVSTITHNGVSIFASSARIKASVEGYGTGLTPLQPTVSGRTLDVSATGEAGIDWANVGSPTTTVGLSGTTIKDATDVETALGLKPTAAQIATALLTDLLSGTDFNTSGSFGKLIKDYLDAAVSSRLASAGYTTPPTAASNAGAVWNETRAGHVTAGTFGEGVIVKTLPSPAPSGYGAIGAVTIDEQDVVING